MVEQAVCGSNADEGSSPSLPTMIFIVLIYLIIAAVAAVFGNLFHYVYNFYEAPCEGRRVVF